jgi:pilus assembly protein Flp/PilA
MHTSNHNPPAGERGAAAIEYGLLIALIAGVIVAAVTATGLKIGGAFDTIVALFP